MTAAAAAATDSLVLAYDLLELPTAQHKAGLAGLVLHLLSLERRGVAGAPVLERLDPLGAAIRFDPDSLQVLMDDLYASEPCKVLARSKYANKEPVDVTEVEVQRDGKTVREKRYVYDDFRPSGEVLRFWLQEGEQSPWLKLWRDMLWGVLRSQPRARIEFRNRADGKPVGLAEKLWNLLLKADKARAKGRFVTDSIAGSLYVGAQDHNAERVAFLGRVEHNLLLHFWQWAVPVFVPRTIDPRSGKWQQQGYLLAVPEVADLTVFCDDMVRYWQGLDPAVSGFRPAGALIDLPAEGGLEFLYHLARHRLRDEDYLDDLHAVELYHQEKQGNNVRQLAAERLLPNPRVLGEYQRIRDRRAHPLFKRLLIGNLLRGESWFAGAQDLFARYPVELFMSARGGTFGRDVRKQFQMIIDELEETPPMENQPEDALARRVYKLVGNYLHRKAKERSRLTDEQERNLKKNEKGYPIYPREYDEAKEKVATSAFLAIRGRRDQDIVEYFTGTLCAVPQPLPKEEFPAFSTALMDDPERVKNLAMLALSAQAWRPRRDEAGAAE